MRLGSSIKYIYTKQEMIDCIRSIDRFSHLHEDLNSILDSYLTHPKIYFHGPNGEVFEEREVLRYVGKDVYSKVTYYWPEQTIEDLYLRWGIKCLRCGGIQKGLSADYKRHMCPVRRTWLDFKEFQNKDKYVQQSEFCESCANEIVTACNYLLDNYVCSREVIKIFSVDKLLEVYNLAVEASELNQIVLHLKTEIRNKKKAAN